MQFLVFCELLQIGSTITQLSRKNYYDIDIPQEGYLRITMKFVQNIAVMSHT